MNKIASSYSLKWHQQECFASPECVKQLTRNLASLLGILCILASGLELLSFEDSFVGMVTTVSLSE